MARIAEGGEADWGTSEQVLATLAGCALRSGNSAVARQRNMQTDLIRASRMHA